MKKYKFYILLNCLVSLFPLAILIGWIIIRSDGLLYTLGVSVGIWISVLLFTIIVIKLKMNHMPVYDERQLKSRGECFSVSFFVLMGCLFLDGLIRMSFNYDWSSYIVGVTCCAFVSVGTFAIMAIVKDAYTSVGENKLKFGLLLGIIGVIDVIVGIVKIVQDGLLEDGQVGLHFMNLFGGCILIVITIVSVIKYFIEKKQAGDEDEEFTTEVC